jgi:nitroreductase
MDFLDLVKKRRSVRNYLDKPVSDALLDKVLEAGRLAPSACNNQPWSFIVLRGASVRQKLANVYKRDWFLDAPAVIAVCSDTSASWKSADGRDSAPVDAGLGTCWVCAFNAAEARKALMLPEKIDPIAFTPLGHPGPEKPEPKNRKPLRDIVFRDRYGNR